MDSLTGAYAAGLLPEEDTFRPAAHITIEEAAGILAAAGAYAGLEAPEEWVRTCMEQAEAYQAQDSASTAEDDQLTRGAAAYLMAELVQTSQEA